MWSQGTERRMRRSKIGKEIKAIRSITELSTLCATTGPFWTLEKALRTVCPHIASIPATPGISTGMAKGEGLANAHGKRHHAHLIVGGPSCRLLGWALTWHKKLRALCPFPQTHPGVSSPNIPVSDFPILFLPCISPPSATLPSLCGGWPKVLSHRCPWGDPFIIALEGHLRARPWCSFCPFLVSNKLSCCPICQPGLRFPPPSRAALLRPEKVVKRETWMQHR